MKKKQKGFTLIELLAVIIVIAIIALIAIPIINGIIKRVEKASFKQTTKGILDTIKLDRSNSGKTTDVSDKYLIGDETIKYEDKEIETKHEGSISGKGYAIYLEDDRDFINYSNGKWCARKDFNSNEIKVTEGDCSDFDVTFCSTPIIEEEPTNDIWSQYKELTITYDASEYCSKNYKINNTELKDYTGKIKISENNSIIEAITKNVENSETNIFKTITKIDTTKPTDVTYTYSRTTNSITITVNATDSESGIGAYAFSIDDGASYTEYQTSKTYTFRNLKSGTYKIKVKAWNGTYGSKGAREEIGATVSDKKLDGTNDPITLLQCQAPTYSVNTSGWAQKKTVSIDYGNVEGCSGSYSIDGGSTWTEGTSVEVITNGQNVIAKNTDGTNTVTSSVYQVTKIDRTVPTKVSFTTTKTTNSITITANAEDGESGILRYAFSKDNGEHWTNYQTSNVYTYSGLTTGTYKIKVKAYNGTYGSSGAIESLGASTSDITAGNNGDVTLNACPTPTYSVSPSSGWAQKKTVTINYGSMNGCIGSYSIDGGATWKTGTTVEVTTNEQNVIAKNTDGTNTVTSSAYQVTKIDRTVPINVKATKGTVTSKSIQVTASATDSESGIKMYNFSKDEGASWTGWQTSNVYTFNNLKTGTYKIKVKAWNGTYGSSGAVESIGASTSATLSVATTEITTPTYSVSPSSGWAQSKSVTISYPSEYTNEYSLDGGSTWKSYTAAVTFTGNGTIVARVRDGINTVTTSSYTINGIDRAKPTDMALSSNGDTAYSKTKSVTITLKDTGGSGLATGSIKYGWSTSNSTEPSSYTTVSTGVTTGTNTTTFTASGSGLTGLYYLWVVPVTYKDKANNSNTTTVKSTSTFKFDNTKPTLTLGGASTTKNSITVPITANRDNHSGIKSTKVDYGTSTNYGSSVTCSTSSCTISGLNSNTTYYYRVTTTDSAGNSNTATGSAKTQTECDTSSAAAYCSCKEKTAIANCKATNCAVYPNNTDACRKSCETNTTEYKTCVNKFPTVSLKKTSGTGTSITVQATTTGSITKVEFKIGNGNWIDNGTSKTYTFTGLTPDTNYTIYVRVTNSEGITAEKSIVTSSNMQVTCSTTGGCNCDGNSLSGSVVLVCVDENGKEVSRKTVHSCSGCCGPNCSGGGGSSSTCDSDCVNRICLGSGGASECLNANYSSCGC